MATTMHRLQISLPEWQHQFILQRAHRDGISVAEVIRQLIDRDARGPDRSVTSESLWTIVGIAEDGRPLIDGVPVSEAPDLYLAEIEPPEQEPERRRPRTTKGSVRRSPG